MVRAISQESRILLGRVPLENVGHAALSPKQGKRIVRQMQEKASITRACRMRILPEYTQNTIPQSKGGGAVLYMWRSRY